MPAVDDNTTPTAPTAGAAARPIPCRQCGYDLRGAARDGACPECGAPVERSLGPDRLEAAPAPWLQRIALGLLVAVAAFASEFIILALQLVWLRLIELAPDAGATRGLDAILGDRTVRLFLFYGIDALLLVGVWLSTTRRAGEARRVKWARRGARGLLLASYVMQIAVLVISPRTNLTAYSLLFVRSFVAIPGALAIVCWIYSLVHTLDLSGRKRLVAAGVWVMLVFLALEVAMDLIWLPWLIRGSTAPWTGWLTTTSGVAEYLWLAFLVAFAWWLWRVRREFRSAASPG
ncbi:MAG: hypothetical protein ACF8PN_06915 [Phycisphaerales bacterium]